MPREIFSSNIILIYTMTTIEEKSQEKPIQRDGEVGGFTVVRDKLRYKKQKVCGCLME